MTNLLVNNYCQNCSTWWPLSFAQAAASTKQVNKHYLQQQPRRLPSVFQEKTRQKVKRTDKVAELIEFEGFNCV